MDQDYVVYGAAGTGSVIIEAALTLLGAPYQVIEVGGAGAEAALARANPMRQVPAVIPPGGGLMTESAAILIWLADAHPEARLAPSSGEPARAQFLRWMCFVSAAIYALFWVRDDPKRVGDDVETVRRRTAARIAECWRIMDSQVDPGRYLLGEELTALDLYVAGVSRWAEGRQRFYEIAPKMTPVVRRVDADPRLQALWMRRFPSNPA